MTVEYHVEDDLSMKPSLGYPALYVKISDGKLESIMGIYVDKNLNAVNLAFEDMTFESLKSFDSKPRVYDEFYFFGNYISTSTPGECSLSDALYANKLAYIPKGFVYPHFRRNRAITSWLAH